MNHRNRRSLRRAHLLVEKTFGICNLCVHHPPPPPLFFSPTYSKRETRTPPLQMHFCPSWFVACGPDQIHSEARFFQEYLNFIDNNRIFIHWILQLESIFFLLNVANNSAFSKFMALLKKIVSSAFIYNSSREFFDVQYFAANGTPDLKKRILARMCRRFTGQNIFSFKLNLLRRNVGSKSKNPNSAHCTRGGARTCVCACVGMTRFLCQIWQNEKKKFKIVQM